MQTERTGTRAVKDTSKAINHATTSDLPGGRFSERVCVSYSKRSLHDTTIGDEPNGACRAGRLCRVKVPKKHIHVHTTANKIGSLVAENRRLRNELESSERDRDMRGCQISELESAIRVCKTVIDERDGIIKRARQDINALTDERIRLVHENERLREEVSLKDERVFFLEQERCALLLELGREKDARATAEFSSMKYSALCDVLRGELELVTEKLRSKGTEDANEGAHIGVAAETNASDGVRTDTMGFSDERLVPIVRALFGAVDLRVLFDSSTDENTARTLFDHVKSRGRVVLIAETSKSDVFGFFYSTPVKRLGDETDDTSISALAMETHGRCERLRLFPSKESGEPACVRFRVGDDRGYVCIGGRRGSVWLGGEKSRSFCCNVSGVFEGLSNTALTGQTGTSWSGPYHAIVRIVAFGIQM